MFEHYQVIREYGKYGVEYVVYKALNSNNNIQISNNPVVLSGGHPDDIKDIVRKIMKDIKLYPVLDRSDVDILHDTMPHLDEQLLDVEYDDADENTLLRTLL